MGGGGGAESQSVSVSLSLGTFPPSPPPPGVCHAKEISGEPPKGVFKLWIRDAVT